MRREKTKVEEQVSTSSSVAKKVRAKTGAGRYGAVLTTPECATRQREHSWLASLELAGWTWTAWTKLLKASKRTHKTDSVAKRPAPRGLGDFINKSNNSGIREAYHSCPGAPHVTLADCMRCQMYCTRCKNSSTYSPNNSRRRLVCARLTGISVCFLSSIRS